MRNPEWQITRRLQIDQRMRKRFMRQNERNLLLNAGPSTCAVLGNGAMERFISDRRIMKIGNGLPEPLGGKVCELVLKATERDRAFIKAPDIGGLITNAVRNEFVDAPVFAVFRDKALAIACGNEAEDAARIGCFCPQMCSDQFDIVHQPLRFAKHGGIDLLQNVARAVVTLYQLRIVDVSAAISRHGHGAAGERKTGSKKEHID